MHPDVRLHQLMMKPTTRHRPMLRKKRARLRLILKLTKMVNKTSKELMTLTRRMGRDLLNRQQLKMVLQRNARDNPPLTI